jgi:general stress protein YciG
MADDRRQRTSQRGFASMDPKEQQEIARQGGQSVPPQERSFSKNHSLAAEAGRKGGQNVPPGERSFSKNHALASEAGRKGGQASGGNFKNDPERAARAGRQGGRHSHSGSHSGSRGAARGSGRSQGGSGEHGEAVGRNR